MNLQTSSRSDVQAELERLTFERSMIVRNYERIHAMRTYNRMRDANTHEAPDEVIEAIAEVSSRIRILVSHLRHSSPNP